MGPAPDLDAIDRRILLELQADGRLTTTELAERVGLSLTPCLRRRKRLEDEGYITRTVAVIDQRKVGLPVSVFAQVRMTTHDAGALAAFEAAVRDWPEVAECYLMTGTRDYLLRIVVGDVEAYERFLKDKLTRLPGIAAIESSFALNQVKYALALPL